MYSFLFQVWRFISSYTFFHSCGLISLMVLCVSSLDLRWSLFRFSQTSNRTSSSNKSNSAPNSWAKCLYTTHSWNCHGRSFTFWLHFHSVIFRSQLYLVISDLLHVWISIFGICHSYHYLLGDNNIALLFPPMCRGKFHNLLLTMSMALEILDITFLNESLSCFKA